MYCISQIFYYLYTMQHSKNINDTDMDLATYTSLKNEIESRLSDAEASYPELEYGPMGLVKRTDEYVAAKRRFDKVFNELRNLNQGVSNKIKREYSMLKRFAKIN